MRLLLALLLSAALAACTTVSTKKMDSGDTLVGERLQLTLEGPWNHVTLPNSGPAQLWTMEGVPVDQLLIYSGIKDGEAIHAQPSSTERKSFNFRGNMQPDELVTMFEGMLTRDGSTFKLAKLEPSSFGGGKGIRFEYAMVRKIDNVTLSGVGFASVSNGELFAMLYSAPRLGFFPRHEARVEQIARTAKVVTKPSAQ